MSVNRVAFGIRLQPTMWHIPFRPVEMPLFQPINRGSCRVADSILQGRFIVVNNFHGVDWCR